MEIQEVLCVEEKQRGSKDGLGCEWRLARCRGELTARVGGSMGKNGLKGDSHLSVAVSASVQTVPAWSGQRLATSAKKINQGTIRRWVLVRLCCFSQARSRHC